jgi:hypothetical protein
VLQLVKCHTCCWVFFLRIEKNKYNKNGFRELRKINIIKIVFRELRKINIIKMAHKTKENN